MCFLKPPAFAIQSIEAKQNQSIKKTCINYLLFLYFPEQDLYGNKRPDDWMREELAEIYLCYPTPNSPGGDGGLLAQLDLTPELKKKNCNNLPLKSLLFYTYIFWTNASILPLTNQRVAQPVTVLHDEIRGRVVENHIFMGFVRFILIQSSSIFTSA